MRASPGRPLPACLFCGADATDLLAFEPPEAVEPPEGMLPFEIDEPTAQAAFRAFATSSIWYPRDLRRARLQLRQLLLPAWAFSGAIETHYTGLIRASTRSGKRPVAGSQRTRFHQILVPASRTLSLSELSGLGLYDEGRLQPLEAGDPPLPFEISEMTRSTARGRASLEMQRRHAAALTHSESLLEIHTAALVDDLRGRPVLVPVWIGAYRYRDHPYRVLVNGQTGELLGDAPFSWLKLLAVIVAVLVPIAVLVATVLAS